MDNDKNIMSENNEKNNGDLKKEKEKLLIYRPIKRPKKNNLKYNKDFLESSLNQNENILTNNESTKPNPLINFVSKNEKTKNLHIFKGKHDLPVFGTIKANDKKDNKKILIKNISLNDNNKIQKDTKNDNNDKIKNEKDDKNKNDKEIKNNKNDKNKNIINNEKKEEEKVNIDKNNAKINDNENIKIKLPISSLCQLKKSIILYSKKKYKLPVLSLCHFSKCTILTKRKYNYPVVNNYYFCTKINKKNEKNKEKSFSIESCIGFDFLNSKTIDINNTDKKKQSLKSGKIQINKNNENRKFSSTSKTKRINSTNESKSKFGNPKKKSIERANRYKSASQNNTINSI